MPCYNSHRLFNYSIFIASAFFLYSENIIHLDTGYFLAIGLGFYIGTEFVTPDLDTNSAAYKRWGNLKILMLPYKWTFKHRHSSHTILYGSMVRIFYISVIILALYYLIFRSLSSEFDLLPVHGIIFLMGIITANALHVILDKIF